MCNNFHKTVLIACISIGSTFNIAPSQSSTESIPREHQEPKRIRSIIISGNKFVPEDAIRARITFQEGDLFNATKTGSLIRNLYDLKFFNQVTVETEEVSPTELDLHVIVEEKKKVESVIYEGNSAITSDELEKELKLSEVAALDEEELGLYVHKIKALYSDKNYHRTTVQAELRPTQRGTYSAIFTICDGPAASVKRVCFEGNQCIPAHVLRKMIFTREAWLFGFMNKAGTYKPDMLDVDKFIIENYYQSRGFLAARVVDIRVDIDEPTQNITVTYAIEEGPLFTVTKISAPGNEILTEAQLLAALPIAAGQLYSKELIRESIERLRAIWGRYGYIYADIEPVIIPNFDNNTVEMTFNSDLGKTYTLNKINIIGNQKTCDYVIRRNIMLIEGQLVSLPAMEASKNHIEQLGYFDPQGGVDWRIKKISSDCVDLDLMLKEIKTGSLSGQLSYGGADPQSPSTSVRLGVNVSDRSLWGTGVRASFSGAYSPNQDLLVTLSLFQPWLFNRPFGGGIEFYHRSSSYEDFNNVSNMPKENLTGGNLNTLFFIPGYPDLSTSIAAGAEHISFQKGLRADVQGRSAAQNELMQSFIDRRFASGTSGFVNVVLGQDVRNHPVFPNKGYNWSLVSRIGIPAADSTFGYVKTDFDATWLTPLIGEYDLVFLLHGHAGIVEPLRDRLIPYRDLYNVGGPGSVRGFEFGQIGPQLFSSSIGAKKAFWVNAELIFSITQDQSVRGLVFYDGGAGWDTPLNNVQRALLALPANTGALTNNAFRYRHSIGFGIRLLNPAPIRVDWAFKLDRNKRKGESFFEVHFSMNQEF